MKILNSSRINLILMKGTYNLIIHQREDMHIKVGAIGEDIEFKEGYYIYIGSAMNSLTARIKRHLKKEKKIHWHIDYLLKYENNTIEEVLFNISDEKIECKLAQQISKKGQDIDKFGSTDCNCNSHLIYFKNYQNAIQSVENAYNKLNIPFYNLEYFKTLI